MVFSYSNSGFIYLFYLLYYVLKAFRKVECFVKWVWRYLRDIQNPYIEEEQTTQYPKEKVENDKQRSAKHTHKSKDRVTRTPLITGCELRCFERVSSSCSTSGTCRVSLVPNLVISRRWGKDHGSVYDKWNISVVIWDKDIP